MPDEPVSDLAADLAALLPAASFNRDGLLFEAGRRSVRPRRRWPVALGALLVGLSLGRWSVPMPPPEQPLPVPVEQSPELPPVVAVAPVEEREPQSGYLRQQRDFLRGVEPPPVGATDVPGVRLSRARLSDAIRELSPEGR